MSTNEELPREAREGPIFHPDFGTHAYERYSGSIRGLDALMAMVFVMDGDTTRSEKYLRARQIKIETEMSGPWAINVQHTMLSWQVAMRVAAVEALTGCPHLSWGLRPGIHAQPWLEAGVGL